MDRFGSKELVVVVVGCRGVANIVVSGVVRSGHHVLGK